MTSLINDILSLPLWFSIPLGVIYLALLAYFFHILWRYRRKNALALLLTIVALASGQSAWAAEKTVTYTLDGTGGENYVVNLTATASGDATGTYGTSWNFQTDVTASVTLANGIKLSFGSNKSGNAMAWQDDWLQIESLAGTTNGAYVSLSNDGYYIYHITLKDYNDNLITEAWTTEKSYTYRASSIRLKTIVVEYDNYIPFTGAVITGINNVYAVSTEAVAPAPTVTWHGTTLTKGTHYTLSYQNNEAPGTATITVTSKGIFYKGASISKNYTLRWAQYTVRFHKNDGGNPDATTDQSITYTEQKALTANAFTREDYLFEGWNTQADGNGTAYTDGQSVQNLSATDGAVVHLYAQWRQGGGSCGDNAHWSYDDNGTLSITGTGGTSDFSVGNRPWEQYKDAITTLYIGDGITYIGEDAFTKCPKLATITGGNDLTDVKEFAFNNTPWFNAAVSKTTAVTYLGHVAYCGTNVMKSNVTIQEGTVRIAKYAFVMNPHINYVTIPATVTSIDDAAFYYCTDLWKVNVLGSTPPTLGDYVFYLNNKRTFNVRSADYKTADGWADIFNNTGEYQDYDNFQIRVVSTLALPDGVTASAAAGDKVTAYGTDYYAENAEITLSGLGAEHTDGGITYRSRATVSYNDGQARTDRYTPDANGQATFTMPAADAVVSTEEYGYAVKYIDADGEEKTCTDFTVVGSDYEFGDYYGTATLGVTDYNEHWYAVVGTVNVDMPFRFRGIARLILCDGAALSINASDNSYAFHILGAPLSIYGQTQGTGTLSVTNTGNGINVNHGITINGGTVIATGKYSNGIDINQGGTLTINHGTVTASGRSGIYIDQATLTQNGGTLNAIGSGSSGIYALNNAAVTLGWTNAADRITASSYYTEDDATISVKSGQTLYDGTTAYSGTLDADQLGSLAGKTLLGVDVLLDDDSAQPSDSKNADRIAALADGKQHNIMLQGRRLWKDGDWNTLCLPFAVSDFTGTPLEDATVKELNGSSSNLTDGTLTLNFSNDLNAIEAGKPYIVEWVSGENITNPVFSGVTVKSGLNNTAFTDGQFVGTYSPVAWPEENRSILFLGEKNTLYYPQAGAHVNAFRAYFELSNANGVREFVMNFDEESSEATIISPAEIKEIKERADDAWYTLDGRKLDGKPTKKGMYIYKGKKVKK